MHHLRTGPQSLGRPRDGKGFVPFGWSLQTLESPNFCRSKVSYIETWAGCPLENRKEQHGGAFGILAATTGKAMSIVILVDRDLSWVIPGEMTFNWNRRFDTAYTDAEGHYQLKGLGPGQLLVHVDAVHRGFVRTRMPVNLDEANAKAQRDFTLHRGVLISGKFVDEKGDDWRIGTSYAYAAQISKDRPRRNQFELNEGDFSLTDFRSKYSPESVEEGSPGTFLLGEGDYDCDQAIFPTASTFVIQGMMPGHTMIGLSPNKEKQKVVKILYNGRDILTSGIDTNPGDEIKDITFVVGAK